MWLLALMGIFSGSLQPVEPQYQSQTEMAEVPVLLIGGILRPPPPPPPPAR